jgi:hypothetical protein
MSYEVTRTIATFFTIYDDHLPLTARLYRSCSLHFPLIL